jgi:hypothetical protein
MPLKTLASLQNRGKALTLEWDPVEDTYLITEVKKSGYMSSRMSSAERLYEEFDSGKSSYPAEMFSFIPRPLTATS